MVELVDTLVLEAKGYAVQVQILLSVKKNSSLFRLMVRTVHFLCINGGSNPPRGKFINIYINYLLKKKIC